MEYFQELVTLVFLRDVSQEVANFSLIKNNAKKKEKLRKMRFTNQNVAHEMRTPLASMIVIVDLLISIALNYTEMKQRSRVLRYYRLVKF